MIISANIATYPPRMHSLKQMVASIYDQVDIIRIVFNEMEQWDVPDYFKSLDKVDIITHDTNFTDNGKFWALDNFVFDKSELKSPFARIDNCVDEHEYYFTMDDDLIYPHDYVSTTISNIKKYGMIITYHGRVLKGKGLKYYYNHKVYRCLGGQSIDKRLDVCGTGVTAFSTKYFHPKGLANHKLQRMSDLIFSLEAAKQGKKIGSCCRTAGWIKNVTHEENIFDTESRGVTENQNNLADQIFELNYGRSN